MRVLLIGSSSGRLDCLAEAIARSARTELFILTNYTNESLREKGLVTVGPITNLDFIADWTALVKQPNAMAVISDEAQLEAGVVDRLLGLGIPTVGPTQALARIETSKIYARDLLTRYQIPGNPLWGGFGPYSDVRDVDAWMHGLGEYVIKPDGLTGGKGVRVKGDHFASNEEGMNYALSLPAGFIIEEKLIGVEFSLMSFCGDACLATYPIQDHKRLLEDDKGPNTGGMGSYAYTTQPGYLPFVVDEDIFDQANKINSRVIQALQDDNGQPYRGILYANYIITQKGLRVIEFNARFGDPEVMNLLPLLEDDFVDIAWKMANGRLTDQDSLHFANKASVCKYLVPQGYPDDPIRGVPLDLSWVEELDGFPGLRIYVGGLNISELTGSRAVAMVGIADTLEAAEHIAEIACEQAKGPLYHRSDIGTSWLIRRRCGRLGLTMREPPEDRA